MKRINLKEYSKSMKLLLVFDVLIKTEILAINKDAFLKSKSITPSSYRRARTKEQKVGDEIVHTLSKHFELKLCNESYIEQLETLVSNIYFDINYRVIENHSKYIEILDKLLEEKPILFPILKLIKLFVITFYDGDLTELVNTYSSEFDYISQFQSFFSDELLEIFDLLKLSYSSTFTKEMLAKQYKNGISYSVISAKHCAEKKYYDSLFFALKAKSIFLNENNYRRCISINFTILNNLASTGNFEEYYNVSYEQIQTMKSFNITTEEYLTCQNHRIISSLSLKKYDEVCELIKNNPKITLTGMFCYIIAMFHLKKNGFENWYIEFVTKNKFTDEVKYICDTLIDYISAPEKKKMAEIEKFRIMPTLIEILRWA